MASGRDERSWPVRPEEGWLSVLALLAMLGIMGAAVDDAHWAGWVPGTGASETGFLPQVLVLGAAWGLVGAKLRWHMLLVHVVGATLGAACAILVVAGTLPAVANPLVPIPQPDPYHLWNLVASLQLFLHDVLVRQVRSDQTSAFLLVVAAVGWASGQFAAFAVFRHHRPMSAVLFLGLLLLASMSLTLQHQYPYLVAYAAASLFLLVRLSLAEQRMLWGSSRMGDATAAFALYLRNGVTFIVIALAGAVLLTSAASSAPLAPLWQGSQSQLVAWGLQLDRFASGVVAPIRGPAALFGPSQTIAGIWVASPGVDFQVRSSDGRGYYWQGATYDDFDGHQWKQSSPSSIGPIAAGQRVLAGTADAVAPGSTYRRVTVTVTPVGGSANTVLSPQTPYEVSRRVTVRTAAAGGPVDTIQLADPLPDGGSYQVTALVRDDAATPITGNELAAAGTVYPDWARRYIVIEPGSVGPIVQQTADRLVSQLPADQRDPYHIAKAFQDWLYSGGNFIYDTDVRGACAPGTPVADCLLISKRGYCEYFATTMVMMLRTQQIPSRYVDGYLPGRPTATGVFEVDRSAAHAWVEVYFPTYGWVRFDPTPGNTANGQQPTDLPAGPPVASPSAKPGQTAGPRPSPSFVRALDNGNDNPRRSHAPAAGSAGGGPVDQGPLSLVIGLLVVGLAALLVAWTRLRRGALPNPAAAYNGVARMAARFGYAPRPAQTAYEYAAMLGDMLPAVRPELELVARAKVESTYGHRVLGGARVAAVRRAYGRLRVQLLRLALRYRRRPR
jgi:transglutaminase-like putative cysteine protease